MKIIKKLALISAAIIGVIFIVMLVNRLELSVGLKMSTLYILLCSYLYVVYVISDMSTNKEPDGWDDEL